MELALVPITIGEDRSAEIFASDDAQSLLQMWEDYYPLIGFNTPWIGYYIRQEDRIIGCCAFTGPPVDNKVEISYWTFKEFEGRGIATWACRKLIAIAKDNDPSLKITAKTAPENNASTTILRRNGFFFSGIVQDDEIGDAWEWVLTD